MKFIGFSLSYEDHCFYPWSLLDFSYKVSITVVRMLGFFLRSNSKDSNWIDRKYLNSIDQTFEQSMEDPSLSDL